MGESMTQKMIKEFEDLVAENERLKADVDELTRSLHAVRQSHYYICSNIRGLLHLEHWPRMPGKFNRGMIRLLEERITELEAK